MGYTRNQMRIDGEALRAEIKKRGLKLEQLSVELGYSKSYLNNCILREQMPVAASKYLEMVYEIPANSYKPVAKRTEENPAGLTQAHIEWSIEKALQTHKPIDYERLYKVIYSAVYEALQMPAKEVVNADS